MDWKKLFNGSSDSETAVVERIHKDFDEAQDRLLREAKIFLEKNSVPNISNEEKVKRLINLGFENSEEVTRFNSEKSKKDAAINEIKEVEGLAQLVEYYKMAYPFLKFLTEKELNKICEKYGLSHAPVSNYIKNVPDKNLKEIEDAQKLKGEDRPRQHKTFKIGRFNAFCPPKVKDFFKDEFFYDGELGYGGYGHRTPTQDGLRQLVKHLNYTGNISDEITTIIYDKEGLYICAPKSHFDLKELTKTGQYSYLKTEKYTVKDDPIVFRYCRGGIQVLSKWGLEANDSKLIVPLSN